MSELRDLRNDTYRHFRRAVLSAEKLFNALLTNEGIHIMERLRACGVRREQITALITALEPLAEAVDPMNDDLDGQAP